MGREREAKQQHPSNSSWRKIHPGNLSLLQLSLPSREGSHSFFAEINHHGSWEDTFCFLTIFKYIIQWKKRLCEKKESHMKSTGVVASRLNLKQLSWVPVGTQFIHNSTQIPLKSAQTLSLWCALLSHISRSAPSIPTRHSRSVCCGCNTPHTDTVSVQLQKRGFPFKQG